MTLNPLRSRSKPVNRGYFEHSPDCNDICSAVIAFYANGESIKSIETPKAGIKRWNGNVSSEQFGRLLQKIADNPMFKDWKAVEIYQSNSKIILTVLSGAKIVMSNVDEKTTVFLAMIDEFKRLDKEIDWRETK